jgi:hypothetical protein
MFLGARSLIRRNRQSWVREEERAKKRNKERTKSTKTINRQDRKQRKNQNTFLPNVFNFQRWMTHTAFQSMTPDATDGRGAVRNNRRHVFSSQ